MQNETDILSPARKKRLHIQGYQCYSDEQLNEYKYGIRFAYALCTVMAAVGLIFNNLTLLTITAIVALGGAILPNHPFDYLYNYGVRHVFKKARIPHRTNQGRFACGVASVWLTVTIWSLHNQNFITGYILGGLLLFVAIFVSTMDICIPSMIYNFFFSKRKQSIFSNSTTTEI